MLQEVCMKHNNSLHTSDLGTARYAILIAATVPALQCIWALRSPVKCRIAVHLAG